MDYSKVLTDCGLGLDSKISLVVSWVSAGTTLKAKARLETEFVLNSTSAADQQEVVIEIPGSDLSLDVTILTRLVLVRAGKGSQSLAAYLPGSILWEDKRTLLIEGVGSRFPMEAIPFTSDSSDAAWFLQIEGELDQPFLGTVRLFLNSRNTTVMKAVQSVQPDAADQMLISSMYYDVGRQLIRSALDSTEFREAFKKSGGCPFPENSLGRALWAMVTPLTERSSITDLYQELTSNPASLERGLQHHFRMFSESRRQT